MMGAIIRMSGAELKSAKPQNDIPSIDCCAVWEKKGGGGTWLEIPKKHAFSQSA